MNWVVFAAMTALTVLVVVIVGVIGEAMHRLGNRYGDTKVLACFVVGLALVAGLIAGIAAGGAP